MGKSISQEQKMKLVEMYRNGVPYNDIKREVGLDSSQIAYWRKKFNLTPRLPAAVRPRPRAHNSAPKKHGGFFIRFSNKPELVIEAYNRLVKLGYKPEWLEID